ncbi:MAG TPA: hypothetical protein VMV06_08640 [Acidimicrobiales bacterium]|nr:hypothetical protein [Acidimicrobiales bacterium]
MARRARVLAVEIHDPFMGQDHDTGDPAVIAPDPTSVADRLR